MGKGFDAFIGNVATTGEVKVFECPRWDDRTICQRVNFWVHALDEDHQRFVIEGLAVVHNKSFERVSFKELEHEALIVEAFHLACSEVLQLRTCLNHPFQPLSVDVGAPGYVQIFKLRTTLRDNLHRRVIRGCQARYVDMR